MCVLRFVGVARAEHMEKTVTGASGEGPPQLWVVMVTAWVGSEERTKTFDTGEEGEDVL